MRMANKQRFGIRILGLFECTIPEIVWNNCEEEKRLKSYLPIYLSVCLSICLSMATLAAFQFLNPIYIR
jgi:hypothetical protein